jgi:hypothetical protein
MVFANATNFHRKSGVAEGRDLRCAIRMPHLFRSTITFSFVISGKPTDRTLISQHEELATSKNPRQQFHSRFSSICTSSAHRHRPRDQLRGLNQSYPMAEFIHLHLHTDYSLLDGACDVEKLAAHVDSIGQKAVAITDHGNIYGAVHFFEAAKAKGIKPILGCEL